MDTGEILASVDHGAKAASAGTARSYGNRLCPEWLVRAPGTDGL